MFAHMIISRRLFIRSAVATGLVATAAAPALAARKPAMTTFHDPGCGCCHRWTAAMRQAGFTVTVKDADMVEVKKRLKVPDALASCHTTLVGGLVVEGHVPASAITRLLARRPKGIIGISAPGMPRGAPGMEMPDGSKDPLNLTLFSADGKTRPFA